MESMIIPVPVGQSTSLVDPSTESTKLADVQGELANLRNAVADLKRQIEKQSILLRAIFALLSTRVGIREDELLAEFQRLESASSASAPTIMCMQCCRPINLRHNRCLYCGAIRQVESAFELL
jgi:hypothetical protein